MAKSWDPWTLAPRRCRENTFGNASYKQCKEAMNPDRKTRKGFWEELREKRDRGHCRSFGDVEVSRTSWLGCMRGDSSSLGDSGEGTHPLILALMKPVF